MLAKPFDGLIREDAIQTAAVCDDLGIRRDLLQPSFQFIQGNGTSTRDMTGFVFACRAHVQHHDVVRPQAVEEFLHPDRLELAALLPVVELDLMKLSETGLPYVAECLKEPNDALVGEAVVDISAFLARLGKACPTEHLEML